jgi:hypothetical protein
MANPFIPIRSMKKLFVFLILSSLALTFTSGKTIHCPTVSQLDFENAYYVQSVPGDTIVLPAGSATWGNPAGHSNAGIIYIITDVTVVGQGDSTVITLHDSGPTYSNGVIALWGSATFKDMKFVGSSARPVTAFNISAYNSFNGGFRLSNITFEGGASDGYFAYVGPGVLNGLIDNCRINGGVGYVELIFIRGPSDAWTTVDTLGAANNIFVEDCTFGGQGYVCDANSNGRMVVRFCTITGGMKIDGHGLASNSPARGVRHMEAYRNTWTTTSQFKQAFELRGGTGYFFDNTSTTVPGTQLWFILNEYGCLATWSNFGFQYQTPADYPINDQIGVGRDPKAAGSAPMYLWNNIAAGVDWAIRSDAIPAGAITRYRSQTGDPSATFTMADIIKADRDYFKGTVGAAFDGSSGVGRGTKAQMLAITPTKTGVGFWVTDEGEWNGAQAGADGQFYVWDGSAWALRYKPYTYPHPLRAPKAPTNLRLSP